MHSLHTFHIRRLIVILKKLAVRQVASYATIAWVAVAASMFNDIVFAQDNPPTQESAQGQDQGPTQGSTRASMRRANHKLEHNVRVALSHAKVDTTDIMIRAKGGKVSLIGYVPDERMIAPAGAAAGKVTGVSAVDNRVILRPEGN
jgi:hyperosmotically inducible protein